MGKKRILLIASCPLGNDGLTKIELDIIRFNGECIEFEIACGYGFPGRYRDWLKTNKIPFLELPQKRNLILYMFSIIKIVRTGKYDSVYIHGNSAMMFLEAIPAKIGGAKVITHCHNTKSDYPIIHYLMKPFFNLAVDKKIGCSVFASKWAYCGKNIITIPNGVETDKFVYDESVRQKVRESLGWSDCRIVGHIGRFNKQKNHSKLIRIFNEMYRKEDGMRLLLIGDGDLRSDIVNDIKRCGLSEYVKIISYTEKPQEFMQAMDIMILPSLYEGLCLVAVEAQANGMPVLIDLFFSPETSATEQATAIDLSLSDVKWAEYSFNLLEKGRKNVIQQIKDKKMDQNEMMKEIQRILIN